MIKATFLIAMERFSLDLTSTLLSNLDLW